MASITIEVQLPFYLRMPEGNGRRLTLQSGSESILFAVLVSQPTDDPIGPPFINAPGSSVRLTNNKFVSTDPTSLPRKLPATKLVLTVPNAPKAWVKEVSSADSRPIKFQVNVDRFLGFIWAITNRTIQAYRWVSRETWNGDLIRELTSSEVYSRLTLSIDEGDQYYLHHQKLFDSTRLCEGADTKILELLGDQEFPEGWQQAILAAESSCEREEIGLALVLADTALELFIDQRLASRMPERYVIESNRTTFDEESVPETYKKYCAPLRAATGKGLPNCDNPLYQDLIHLILARNSFVHRGTLEYEAACADGTKRIVPVNTVEAKRLVECARRAIVMAQGLLAQSSPPQATT